MPLLNTSAHNKVTLGDRSFLCSSVWNSIPNDVWCAPSLSSFNSHLKTYLFLFCTFSLTTAWFGIVIALLIAFLRNALMFFVFFTQVKLINHDCLPILMLLYIMLAYLLLFDALSNAVCLCNDFFSFFTIDFFKCFLFSCFILVY